MLREWRVGFPFVQAARHDSQEGAREVRAGEEEGSGSTRRPTRPADARPTRPPLVVGAGARCGSKISTQSDPSAHDEVVGEISQRSVCAGLG